MSSEISNIVDRQFELHGGPEMNENEIKFFGHAVAKAVARHCHEIADGHDASIARRMLRALVSEAPVREGGKR